MTIDEVVVAVTNRPSRKLRRIRARGFRLGHRKAGAHLAGQTGLEPLALLLGGSELGQNLHIAGIGGHAIEGACANWTPAHNLAQGRIFRNFETLAVFAIGQKKVPKPGGLGPLANILENLWLAML